MVAADVVVAQGLRCFLRLCRGLYGAGCKGLRVRGSGNQGSGGLGTGTWTAPSTTTQAQLYGHVHAARRRSAPRS